LLSPNAAWVGWYLVSLYANLNLRLVPLQKKKKMMPKLSVDSILICLHCDPHFRCYQWETAWVCILCACQGLCSLSNSPKWEWTLVRNIDLCIWTWQAHIIWAKKRHCMMCLLYPTNALHQTSPLFPICQI